MASLNFRKDYRLCFHGVLIAECSHSAGKNDCRVLIVKERRWHTLAGILQMLDAKLPNFQTQFLQGGEVHVQDLT